MKAKKIFGQHFLKDHEVLQSIVASFPDDADTTVLEVGPGRGVLTRLLLDKFGDRFYTTEIDDDLIPFLHNEFPELGDRLIHVDFLDFDLSQIPGDRLIICGNFPYNISSQIVFKVYEHRHRVVSMIGMFQKEVSERVVAPPGKKVYGILSVLMKAFYDGEEVVKVPPTAFDPPPKVDSSVIKLTRNSVEKLDCDERLFKQVVKLAFNQRRKMIRNSLRGFVRQPELMEQEIFTRRPEQLSLEDFISLTQMFQQQKP